MPACRVGAVVAANRRVRATRGGTHVNGGARATSQQKQRAAVLIPNPPPPPLPDDGVAAYLEQYEYLAQGPDQWQRCMSDAPKLTTCVLDHTEIDGHTYYRVECRLAAPSNSSPLEWQVQRRLLHLREGLHDYVHEKMGELYDTLFNEVPFARHGGLPGTTARLDAWLSQLAACVSNGTASPSVAARMIHFLGAPIPSSKVAPGSSSSYGGG